MLSELLYEGGSTEFLSSIIKARLSGIKIPAMLKGLV